MGSYLIINNKENNSKAISYTMYDLIERVLPDKKLGEKFRLNVKDVAAILDNATHFAQNDDDLERYIAYYSDDYAFQNNNFEQIKDIFIWIKDCFSEILTNMILDNKNKVVCYWV